MSIILKNQRQIDGIRKSSQLAAKTLDFVESFIISGVSTQRLNELCENFIRDNGATPAPLGYKGYPKAVCTSINDVICHGIPSENEILTDGDIINIDVTTILNKYYGDTSRTFIVGNGSAKVKKLVQITHECLWKGIEQVKPNNHVGNIGWVITEHATKNGFSVVYQFVGHGVGLGFHEAPEIKHVSNKNTGPLMKPGMIFTIEPMLNENRPEAVISESDGWTARTMDGGLSAQFEHTILVTETGYEVLTINPEQILTETLEVAAELQP